MTLEDLKKELARLQGEESFKYKQWTWKIRWWIDVSPYGANLHISPSTTFRKNAGIKLRAESEVPEHIRPFINNVRRAFERWKSGVDSDFDLGPFALDDMKAS